MLDYRNLTFSSANLWARAIMPPNSEFRLNRTIRSRVIYIAKKMIFIMASVRHLEFGNFGIFLTFPSIWSKFASAYQIFIIFGRFAAEIWIYNDFQNGGRPPCWIYCDVIILRRKTEFNACDIMLNFDKHRFHTFWYTSTIMFHHFSLKLPIFALIFTYFLKKYGKY